MPDKNKVKEYTDGELTIVWKPGLCIHSENCWNGEDGLKSVFNPDKRPWIDPEGASNERIRKQIERCPSGALSYYNNNQQNQPTEMADSTTSIKILSNGPCIVTGSITIEHPDGTTEKKERASLCRCGASGNKPYCDGSHKAADFQAS